jgi:hypothetical protein
LPLLTGFGFRRVPAVGAQAQQGSVMRLDLKADLAVDPTDQRIKSVDGDVDHSLTVGALQMGMRRRRGSIGRRG